MPSTEQAQALVNLAADLLLSDNIEPQDILSEFAKIGVWREMGLFLPNGNYERVFLSDNYTRFNPHNP